jgi:hypothetical protein
VTDPASGVRPPLNGLRIDLTSMLSPQRGATGKKISFRRICHVGTEGKSSVPFRSRVRSVSEADPMVETGSLRDSCGCLLKTGQQRGTEGTYSKLVKRTRALLESNLRRNNQLGKFRGQVAQPPSEMQFNSQPGYFERVECVDVILIPLALGVSGDSYASTLLLGRTIL